MDIVRTRLAAQFLTGEPLATPVEVVRRLGAVQAQDYQNAKWAIGQRTRSATDADVEGAVSRGEILRTHVLRPTWHFVLPEDIRWMLALTGPRIDQAMASYNRKLGLTPGVLRRTRAAIETALRDGQHLTRAELKAAIARSRAPKLAPQPMGHAIMQAEIEGVICSGRCRDKAQTYALLDSRVPRAAPIDRDEALARLAERYFSTRGPASVHDFAWWSGLTVRDARRSIEILNDRVIECAIEGVRMWRMPGGRAAPPAKDAAHLLPNYDEYFIGFKDRSSVGRRLNSIDPVTGGDARTRHVAFVGGELVGAWSRSTDGAVTVTPWRGIRLTERERRLLDRERRRLEAFLVGPSGG